MQFRVVHTTRIAYDGGVAASYNEARMTPLTSRAAGRRAHPARRARRRRGATSYRDYWGTEVTAFEVLDQHSELHGDRHLDRAGQPAGAASPAG